jgi:hypothetical protein
VDELGALDGDAGWGADRWDGALTRYFAEYDRIGTGPAARSAALLHVDTDPGLDGRQWRVRQVFDDPEGDADWGITAVVDLDASDEAGEPVVRVVDVGPFS